jgi:TRAP-type C4-dicarboxylate transport system permease small subunit
MAGPNRAHASVDRAIRAIANALSLVAGVCLVLMMLQMVLDVVLKYVFNTPIEGNLQIVSRYYMVGVVFLPLAMVELRHGHINVDLFTRLLPQRGQNYVYAFSCLVAAVFFVALTYQTALDALHAMKVNEMIMGSIYVTIWPARWMLPIGFAVIALAVLLHAWRALRDPDRFRPEPDSPDFPPDQA